MKDKKPNIESAAVTARCISRLLKKNGFPVSTNVDKYTSTEGCYVSRIGYSNSVSINYYTNMNTIYTKSKAEAHKKKAEEALSKVRQFLTECGYVFENNSYMEIKCNQR